MKATSTSTKSTRSRTAGMPHGAHVTIGDAFVLVATIAGARFEGRFLFLPSSLCAGDQVWLRLMRVSADTLGNRLVDVTGRVACVFAERESRNAWRPMPGGRFSVSVDKITPVAATAARRTRERWALDDDDDERAPTEPNCARASFARTLLDTVETDHDTTLLDAPTRAFTAA